MLIRLHYLLFQKVYAIAQSSVFISCLSFQAPYIEISNINKKQRKMYPKIIIF